MGGWHTHRKMNIFYYTGSDIASSHQNSSLWYNKSLLFSIRDMYNIYSPSIFPPIIFVRPSHSKPAIQKQLRQITKSSFNLIWAPNRLWISDGRRFPGFGEEQKIPYGIDEKTGWKLNGTRDEREAKLESLISDARGGWRERIGLN